MQNSQAFLWFIQKFDDVIPLLFSQLHQDKIKCYLFLNQVT